MRHLFCTFITNFLNPEIAEQQDISYQNVCKRISQARKILQEELRGYFIEEEETDRDKSVTPTATESEIGEMSEGNREVEVIAGKTVLAVAVEEVESVGDEEGIEVARDVPHYLLFLSSFQFSMEVNTSSTLYSKFDSLETFRNYFWDSS